ncbi:MAG: hypothetical protein GXP08_14715 [Gammaproteobacteria bacterium]|nr:hypothetical protein [Gammaproteobacteria bacterium]
MYPSLRNHLLVILFSIGLATWLITATIIYIDSRTEIGELLDAELAQIAKVLLTLSNHELHEEMFFSGNAIIPLKTIDMQVHPYEKKLVYQVWLDQDQLVLVSSNSPLAALATVDNGYSIIQLNNQQWRVFSLSDQTTNLTVHVGELHGGRQALTDHIAKRALVLILIAFTIAAGLTWLGIGRALNPLNKLADQVAARHPFDLTSIHNPDAPKETKPLIDSINKLLQRLDTAFYNERCFTANAAHELRTPLAGIAVHNDIALLAASQRSRRKALLQIKKGINLMSRLVQQLLTLARLDQDSVAINLTPVSLRRLTASIIEEQSNFAKTQDTCIRLEQEDVTVLGIESALAVMIRNLLDNAIRYSPPNGLINIAISSQTEHLVFRITDNGPGIPLQERLHVFQRFYRLKNHNSSGSGLGLSIVQRCIDLHRAEILLSTSRLGGLALEIRFPKTDRNTKTQGNITTPPPSTDGKTLPNAER